MSKIAQILHIVEKNPRFAFMRAAGRFRSVREGVKLLRHYAQRAEFLAYKKELERALPQSLFRDVDRKSFVTSLKRDGVAFGLALPPSVLNEILTYADKACSYADRESDKGFFLTEKQTAEKQLGKPILLSQYFNSEDDCDAIRRLRNDPFLQLVAAEYLNSIPTHVGTNMWWTFPVNASAQDRARHAHVFHRDLDDFAFFKFFFYLTDVENDDGAHACIPTSHRRPPTKKFLDRFLFRRWTDEEICDFYGNDAPLVINGKTGIGFAEDTLCIHKGNTPTVKPRLLLQVQFALFDYGVQHDVRPQEVLRPITQNALSDCAA